MGSALGANLKGTMYFSEPNDSLFIQVPLWGSADECILRNLLFHLQNSVHDVSVFRQPGSAAM